MSVFQLFYVLHFLKNPEVCHLIDDLDLDFPDSFACKSMCDELARQRDPLYGVSFDEDIAESDSQRYPDLLDVYAKHNSKGSRRSFGCSFEKQLILF